MLLQVLNLLYSSFKLHRPSLLIFIVQENNNNSTIILLRHVKTKLRLGILKIIFFFNSFEHYFIKLFSVRIY